MRKVDILTLDFSLGGGIERVVSNMAKMFADYSDYEVRIVSAFNKNGEPQFDVPSSIEVLFLSNKEYNLTSPWKKFHSNIELCRVLMDYHSDAVIISTTTNVTQWLSLLGKTKGKIVIAAEHAYYWAFGRFSRLVRQITYKRVTSVVTLTKSEISAYKGFVNTVVSIPNSLSFTANAQNDYLSKRVIAAGRAVREKGFDQLLDIYSALASKHTDWHFDLFSGEGYLLNDLKEKIKTCPSNVHLYPATKNLQNELLNSELFVCTSYTESFSMVIVEAMSCGVCPVSYKCPPGPLEIINDGNNGVLVNLNNKEEMIGKLDYLINNKNERLILGKNAKADSEKYLPSNVFVMWDKLIREVVSE